jgi:hypothetical protein
MHIRLTQHGHSSAATAPGLRSVSRITDDMQWRVVHRNYAFVTSLAVRSSARLHFIGAPLRKDRRTPFLSKPSVLSASGRGHSSEQMRPGDGGCTHRVRVDDCWLELDRLHPPKPIQPQSIDLARQETSDNVHSPPTRLLARISRVPGSTATPHELVLLLRPASLSTWSVCDPPLGTTWDWCDWREIF